MSESPTDLDTSGRENTRRDEARNGQVTADTSGKRTEDGAVSNQTQDDSAKQAERKKRPWEVASVKALAAKKSPA